MRTEYQREPSTVFAAHDRQPGSAGIASSFIKQPEGGSVPDPLAIHAVTASDRIQRDGMAWAMIRLLQAGRMYDDFVGSAERYGLPVRFLRRVGRDYDISFGSSSAVNAWLNSMTLEEKDLESAGQMAPVLPIGEGSAIRTVYEEATHAYLDPVSDEPEFDCFIGAGERHYESARTTGGAAATDPGRLFQEAVANCVAHRASVWWLTFEFFSIYMSMAANDPAAAGRA